MSDNFRIDIFLVLENKGKLTRTMLSRQKNVLHSTFEAGLIMHTKELVYTYVCDKIMKHKKVQKGTSALPYKVPFKNQKIISQLAENHFDFSLQNRKYHGSMIQARAVSFP